MDLTSAIFGGNSDADASIGMAGAEGVEELSDEQLAMWREILGEQEFQRQFGDYLQ